MFSQPGSDSDSFSGRAPPRAPFRSFPASKTVYVGNLFFSVREQDIEREMSRVGKVESVKIIYDARGLSKGFVSSRLTLLPPVLADC